MTAFEDVPLPGLDYEVRPRQRRASLPRPYDAKLAPTDRAITSFWDRVVFSPGCWIWVGAISDPDGYGRITWRAAGTSRSMSAHRFALTIAEADTGAGTIAEHRCNEPLCVRVDADHVITSTQTANLAYAVALGRAGVHRPPADGRTRAERSRAVRDAVRGGWDPLAYSLAAGETIPSPTPKLF